ncbi:hypothetical protein EYF80_058113 [Liparis tanakae]|uniref:Uncharacterized protein n=1 Tax=Liparis tanakae TaxID=230148 RepID=A0A4Z2ESE2_9TELE|nr:hypothetical protein EYF80_058113 [Liparis tanakae]
MSPHQEECHAPPTERSPPVTCHSPPVSTRQNPGPQRTTTSGTEPKGSQSENVIFSTSGGHAVLHFLIGLRRLEKRKTHEADESYVTPRVGERSAERLRYAEPAEQVYTTTWRRPALRDGFTSRLVSSRAALSLLTTRGRLLWLYRSLCFMC